MERSRWSVNLALAAHSAPTRAFENTALCALSTTLQVDGPLPPFVTSKDIVLHICGVIGTAGGTGSTIEFAGQARTPSQRPLPQVGCRAIADIALRTAVAFAHRGPHTLSSSRVRARVIPWVAVAGAVDGAR